MDVLGYKQMIQGARTPSQGNKLLARLHGVLRVGRRWLEEKDQLEPLPAKETFALKAFTDNIVVDWPVYSDGESEFAQAFFKLAYFQLEMVKAGFFVRGAVSVADAFVDEIAVFGSALNEAYMAESQLARDPRIVLTSSAVDTVRKHLDYYGTRDDCPYTRELLRDCDGQWYLNYLDCVLIPTDDGGDPWYAALLCHKRIVEEQLNQFKDQPSIWSKYMWVARYHDYFCERYSKYFPKKYRINQDLLRLYPSLIDFPDKHDSFLRFRR
jgi:hypothetical protein